MSQSTSPARGRKAVVKPSKPYPEFPLTPHASGAWMKKIRGRIHYFGKWGRRVDGKLVRIPGDGWKEALDLYKVQADDLHAGRTPRVQGDGLTVADLCNRFLTSKLRKRDAGEMGLRGFVEYKEITDLLVGTFGGSRVVDDLAADDFAGLRASMAKRWGPVRLGNAITRTKSVFKYGMDNGLIEKAVRYGSEFHKPDAAVLRRHRASAGEKLFTASEVLVLLEGADSTMRAMILLGVNCGFGNTDCAALTESHLDLENGWIDFPRPKTGIPRRCPLWPETVAAVRAVLASRPTPESGLVFITPEGLPWIRQRTTSNHKLSNINKVAIEFGKLVERLIPGGGHGYYSLRHTFRTVADGSRDQPAADLIMGHTDPSMRGRYVERIEDVRLRAVADHVRNWLFTTEPLVGTKPEVDAAGDPSEPPMEDGMGWARPTLRLFVETAQR